jgi:Flp pilus assembly protein TadD
MRDRVSGGILLAALLVLAALMGCGRGGARGGLPPWLLKPSVPAGTDLEEIFRHNNLGVAHLEQHHYAEAAKEFEKVAAALPGWAEGEFNLGVALLNLHENPRAEDLFRKALAISPTHPFVHYSLGLALKQDGKTDEAMAEFKKVEEVVPGDPDTLYNIGLLYARDGKHAEAVEALRKTLASQPANVSARFRLATSLLALGKKEEGDREMSRFREMNGTGVALSMGLQYSEQGKYSFALTDYRAFGQVAPPKAGSRVFFTLLGAGESGLPAVPASAGKEPLPPGSSPDARTLLCSYGPGIAVSDIDGDGDPDLFIPGCGGEAGPGPALLRNDGSGKLTDVTREAGLETAVPSVAAAFGDFDNDGHPDLYVTGPDGNHLYRNRGDGTFEDVTAAAGVKGSGLCLAPAWADADHDGDLDLVVPRLGASPGAASGAPLLFFINNGNGTFRETASEKRTDRPLEAVAAAFGDLDDDRDVDFVVSTASGPLVLFDNDRIGTFTARGREWGLPEKGLGDGAVLADLDGDGWTDLFLPRTGWLRNREGKGFELRHEIASDAGALGAAAFDFDNDGDLDLLVAGKGLRLLRNEGAGRFTDATVAAGLDKVPPAAWRGVAAVDLDSDGDLDLVLSRNGAPPAILRNDGGNLNSWLRIRLAGLHSNKAGVGTKVEVHSGSQFQRREVRLGNGYLSQEPETILFGLGGRKLVDFVRLMWPGGVLQSELEVSAEQTLEISELDRKGSSCPILFAWNGFKFGFITDFLGVGGLGFLIKPGIYGPPDPDEYLKLEGEQLKERDGTYLLQILENLEEISYLDEAKLLVVDHPVSSSVYPNERFGGDGPPPFTLFSYQKPLLPVSARDEQDRPVAPALTKVDRIYPDGFRLMEHLPGYAETHTLTLDFGDALRGKENLVLFLYGWVDYGYSSTNLAASQAGIELMPPRLEAMGAEGTWETLVQDMGYPAGLPRMMTVDLRDHAPFTDGRFRITTNLRVYWDQIFMAEVEKDPAVKITKLSPAYADLHAKGYPREHSPDGKQPLLYDYSLMDHTFPFRNMAGSYTRFGQVSELVQEADDRFVIFGRGEELTLKFKATKLPALPKGWKRDFLLYVNGYCKDMDPNTAFPDTVDPLPFHGMSAYPYPEGEHFPDDPAHLDYLKKYNTRRLEGRP